MPEEHSFIGLDVDQVEETSWLVVALVVAVDVAFLVVAMRVVLPFLESSLPIDRLTAGLIQPTLLFSILRYVLAVLGVAVLLGGLGARDVGLQWEKLASGALVVLGAWVAMQVIGALVALSTSGQLALSPIWAPDRLTLIAGELIAQFLGNAFAEEVIFRGFLLMQVTLMLRGAISERGRVVTASLLISQLIFALSHIPQRIGTGYSAAGLVVNLMTVWVTGIVFGLVYLRTGNLFIAIGLHALINAPVTIMALPSRAVAELLALVLPLVLILAWRPLNRWKERLGMAQYA